MTLRSILALAALALSSAAYAQTPTPSEAVQMEQFCAPDRVAQRRFYPERAEQRNLDGSARVDCALSETNTLQSCSVLEETPRGFGFGEAALGVACRWTPGPDQIANATPAPDGSRHIQRTIRFTLSTPPPPAFNQ